MKKLVLIFFVFAFSKVFGQTPLFHLDLTDTTKFIFGNYDYYDGYKVQQITGAGTYSPVYRQLDTALQPYWRKNEGLYFKKNATKSNYLTLLSGNKTLPTSTTITIVFRHLGKSVETDHSYLIGDTNSFAGYDMYSSGIRIFSSGGEYSGRRFDEYAGIKTIITFRVRANQIDTVFINGFDYSTGTVTLGSALKFGILGAYSNGTSIQRSWSGYIYEILAFDGLLSNQQIDTLHESLSEKHKIAIKFINPTTVPYANQPRTGTGTNGDPFLIYSVHQFDSLRYIYPKNQIYYVKLMTDLDFQNYPNNYIDSLTLDIDGNHKTIRNLWYYGSKTIEDFALLRSFLTDTITIKNLRLFNCINIADAGQYSNSYVGFVYSKSSSNLSVNGDSLIIERCLVSPAEKGVYGINYKLLGGIMNPTAKRIGLKETEIIYRSKMTGSMIVTNYLQQFYTDKYTTFGNYLLQGGTFPNVFLAEAIYGSIYLYNSYFHHKVFTSTNTNYEGSNEYLPTTSISYDLSCCYPIKSQRFSNTIYTRINPIYTISQSQYQTLSYDAWTQSANPLNSVFIDTSYNRGFAFYPPEQYNQELPQVKSKTELNNQTTFTNEGWDFTNIWGISPNKNDGYPYLLFSTPESENISLLYPNTTITKYTGDTLNISFNAIYDTVKIFLVVDTDTIFISNTTNSPTTINIPYGLSSNFCKILVGNTSLTDTDISDTTFTILRDTTIRIYEPYLNQTFTGNDTVFVRFYSDFDTAKIYYRFNNLSSWQYKGIVIKSDTSGQFYFIIDENQFSETAQILIMKNDSTIIKLSDKFYILPNRFIEILTPTESEQIIYSSGMMVKVRSAGISDFDFYIKTTGDYSYVANYMVNDIGTIDTTTFIFDYKEYLISGTISLMVRKGEIGEITGSMDTAYYNQNDFSYVGMRSPYPQFQSKLNFSKIFLYADSLYSVCYYAYPFGWYDYWDRVEVYKYNPQTNFFVKILSRGFPNSAPYPNFLFYRTTTLQTALVKPNEYFRTVGIDIPNNTITDMSGIIYKSNTTGIPINIDMQRTMEVFANYWRYKIIGTKIYAYDLINQGNNFLYLDLSTITSAMTNINNAAFELFAGANKLFITNHNYSDNNTRSDTYAIDLFPANNILTMDEVTIELTSTQRNYFRGIFPKALIKVIPKL